MIETSFGDNVYFAVRDKGETVGIVFGHLYNGDASLLELHVNMLPSARGEFAREEIKKILEFIFSAYTYRAVVAVISEYYPNVIRFALDSGMSLVGEVPIPLTKGGTQYRSFLFIIEKEV